MTAIHPSAVVETEAIGEGVTIGEFAIVRPGAVLGDGVAVLPHAMIDAAVEISADTEVQFGACVGRRPRATGGVTRKPTWRERLRIGPGCAIGTHAVIYYDVEIGADTIVGDHALIREATRVGDHCVIGRATGIANEVEIGDETVVMFAANVVARTTVGRDAFIGPFVSTTNDNSVGAADWAGEEPAGAQIEDGARIGANATLLPGVRIGAEAVVAAGSVVTRDVAPATTVMGNPARPR
jgi:acetyltransferase-like isoleucine patch superfamily enzyme